LLFAAFVLKYAYVLFPEVDYEKQSHLLKNFYPWLASGEVPLMDWRNYVYLIGERFFIMALFYVISQLMYCWQTIVMWVLLTGYIIDFLITFHTSKYGPIMLGIIGLIFISKLIPWKKLFSRIYGSLSSYWQ
jgi:prepilin signal peptidase PulO-like enzyme (type II secretory pathway)